MARFNLICHGMMLFVEEGDYIRIRIPEIEGKAHDYKYGDPAPESEGPCDIRRLKDLPKTVELKLEISGYKAPTGALRYVLSAKDHLMVKTTAAEPYGTARTEIRIPKPNVIRGFRPVELYSRNVFGCTHTNVAIAEPTVLHDALMFSYLDLADRTQVGMSSYSTSLKYPGATLCVYSQDTSSSGGTEHPTAINDLLWLKSASPGHPDFQLSDIGQPDGPPSMNPAKTAIHTCHVCNLKEMGKGTFQTDATGCVGAFLVDFPD